VVTAPPHTSRRASALGRERLLHRRCLGWIAVGLLVL
jgi:hypothetical protein